MTHYSTATVDLTFTGNLSQCGLSHDSQCQRYVSCFRCLTALISLLVKYGQLATDPINHISTFSTITPSLAFSLSLGRRF
jgi:hypothetical protein